jgi:hypothetical protein
VGTLVATVSTGFTITAALAWNFFVPGIPFPITPDAVLNLVLRAFHVFESARLVAALLAFVSVLVFVALPEPEGKAKTLVAQPPTQASTASKREKDGSQGRTGREKAKRSPGKPRRHRAHRK